MRRLVHDGAGHYPSAPDVQNPPDLDVLAVSEYGSLMLWTSTHGLDTRRDSDRQLWILGQEGVLPGLEEYPDLGDLPTVGPDGSVWSDSPFGGVRRFDGETCLRFLADYEIGDIAVTGDGRAWVVASDGEVGGLYAIEGAHAADE